MVEKQTVQPKPSREDDNRVTTLAQAAETRAPAHDAPEAG
jgi:hypothetical protein